MSWWVWLIVGIVIALVLVVGVLAVQVRRRRGGAIVNPSQSPGEDRRGTGR